MPDRYVDATFQAVFFILLGSLLGLLSPLIHDAIKNKRRTREVRKTIISELADIRLTLCCIVYDIEMRFGEYDRKLLEWVLPIFDSYEGPHRGKEIAEKLRENLKMTDRELADCASMFKVEADRSLHLKKVDVPYMEMHIPEFGSFDEATRQLLLAIRAKLAHFNENIEYGQEFFRLTYADITEENRERVVRNLRDSYLQVSERARAVVEHINSLSPLREGSAVTRNQQHGKT